MNFNPEKSLSKEKILHLASRDKGLVYDLNSRDDNNLQARLNIFHLRGILRVEQNRNLLRYRLTKDIYLL